METVWRAVPDARLVIAGASTLETAEIQAMLARSAPGSGRGRWTSFSTSPIRTSSGCLRAASVLVLPSTVESFGIVLLEAWASATPVVALDTPTMRDVVTDGRDGLLVDSDGDEEMAGAIIECLTDPDRARSMGLAGFRNAADRYTWDAAARTAWKPCTSRFSTAERAHRRSPKRPDPTPRAFSEPATARGRDDA